VNLLDYIPAALALMLIIKKGKAKQLNAVTTPQNMQAASSRFFTNFSPFNSG
jgi:hypothetical protein|tara:strand:+ start:7209 stop:7364 length:156 start_codon:yes stop_codon:yes gene_type:complete